MLKGYNSPSAIFSMVKASKGPTPAAMPAPVEPTKPQKPMQPSPTNIQGQFSGSPIFTMGMRPFWSNPLPNPSKGSGGFSQPFTRPFSYSLSLPQFYRQRGGLL